jgi:pimeloyl-ACP methyl ester carboxylesterase
MKIRHCISTLIVLAAAALLPSLASAQAVDYSVDSNWLCRPGGQDACAIDLTTTVVRADGTTSREAFTANPSAPIDCFYVYPTVSTDTTPNSDTSPDAAELRVVAQQFARFQSVCRPYAPSYRQVTLAGLRTAMAAGPFSLDQGMAYDDVLAAWRYYLEHDNNGRGVVLVGHSQGSFILTRLIKEEIDGKPVQGRMVSAILMGAAPLVAKGSDVGGSFQSIRLCRSAAQTGCLIAFSTFRSTAPAPENSLFGIPPAPDVSVVCTNPAALAGGAGELHAYMATDGSTIVGPGRGVEWVAGGAAVGTPWVSLPGLLTAECKTNEHATYLEMTVHGNPADPRIDDINGDLTPQWGLHLVDANVAMGNLVDIVRQQAQAWARR